MSCLKRRQVPGMVERLHIDAFPSDSWHTRGCGAASTGRQLRCICSCRGQSSSIPSAPCAASVLCTMENCSGTKNRSRSKERGRRGFALAAGSRAGPSLRCGGAISRVRHLPHASSPATLAQSWRRHPGRRRRKRRRLEGSNDLPLEAQAGRRKFGVPCRPTFRVDEPQEFEELLSHRSVGLIRQ